MLRVIGWTLASAVITAGPFFLGTLLFVELIQPALLPPRPGEGFNALGFILFLFGTPYTAILGATVGFVWTLSRLGESGKKLANRFGYIFSFLAGVGGLRLYVAILDDEEMMSLVWLMVGGLTLDAIVMATACFRVSKRPVQYKLAEHGKTCVTNDKG